MKKKNALSSSMIFPFITHIHVVKMHLESIGFKSNYLIVSLGGVHPSGIH
jgi:hypothetical protein